MFPRKRNEWMRRIEERLDQVEHNSRISKFESFTREMDGRMVTFNNTHRVGVSEVLQRLLTHLGLEISIEPARALGISLKEKGHE